MARSSKYFVEKELACRCGCGDAEMDAAFLQKMDRIRERAGIPFIVTSAKRCREHNARVSTVTNGPHPYGHAIDIVANASATRYKIITAALAEGITRIGYGKGFIHLDDADCLNSGIWVPKLIWDY